MKETVEILLSADDQASAKFAAVSKAAENNVKTIKDVGGKAKASTEFVGQLAGAFGNSEIGSFAGQLAGLTEKVGQFSEVSKAGGAGAAIFKGGLVAATAYVAFNVGKHIGDWAFETEKLKKEMEGVAVKTKESMDLFRKFQADAASDRKADIELIKDPELKKKAIIDVTKTLEQELARQEKALVDAKALAEKSEKSQSWNYIGNDLTENKAKSDRDAVIALEEKTKATREELTELRRSVNIRAETTAAIIAQDAAAQEAIKATGAAKLQWQELIAAERQKNVDERIKEAELANKEYEDELKNVEALKKAEEERAQKDQAAQAALNAKQADDNARKMQQDSEAAQALAERLGAATTNTASESRLLTRGPNQDKTVEVASNTASIDENTKDLPEKIGKVLASVLAPFFPKGGGTKIELVK